MKRRDFLRTSLMGGASTLAAPGFGYTNKLPSVKGLLQNFPEFDEFMQFGLLQSYVAGRFVNEFARNLRYGDLPPQLLRYFHQAGAQYRPAGMAEGVWKTMPSSIRMAGPDAIEQFLSTRDWSHVVPRKLGGGNAPTDGIFENMSLNRARGAETMTPVEIAAARSALRAAALRQVVINTLKVTVTAGLVTAAVTATFSVMENGLLYHDGEIDKRELYRRVFKDTISGAAIAVAVSGVIVGLCMVFPPLVPVLSAVSLPLAVVSFSLLGVHFYQLSSEWVQRVDMTAAVESWNETAETGKTHVRWLIEKSESALKGAKQAARKAATRLTGDLIVLRIPPPL